MKLIKNREVFYLSGYDPRGARYYHDLYKKESLKQAKVDELDIKVSSRKRTDKHQQSWNIEYESKGQKTNTEYHFLEWDDIIRKRWKRSTISLFLDLFFCMKVYIFSGLIIKIGKLSPLQIVPAFFPVVYLLFTLLGSFLLVFYIYVFLEGFFLPIFSLLLASFMAYLFIRFMVWIGDKIAVFWLLSIYVFCAKYVLEEMPNLDKRCEIFSSYILDKIKENKSDEILIVGHSVGTIIAISVLAKVLSHLDDANVKIPKISFLTLGHCIPLVSFLPEAKKFKSEMSTLSRSTKLRWLDYTSSVDGGCFPQLDYYKHSGLEEQAPAYLSPRFHTLYLKEHYKKIRKNKYLTHFLYLMATDKKNGYNFFKISAGNHSL